jgi:hypothetical protein
MDDYNGRLSSVEELRFEVLLHLRRPICSEQVCLLVEVHHQLGFYKFFRILASRTGVEPVSPP